MAELTPKERLQPSLLDRLTDDEPEQKLESRDKRVLSPERLRESVRRDLTWLFNTPSLATVIHNLSEYPEVERSTVNFGLPSSPGARRRASRWRRSNERCGGPSWISNRAS